jgi:hypothetical protein
MHADIGDIAGFSFSLMLTIPVIFSVMFQYSASMRVDVYPVVIGPQLSGTERFGLAAQMSGCRKNEGESQHCYRLFHMFST